VSNIPRRPTPRAIFHTKDRQVQVFFYTSNIQKYLQARLVFDSAGLILQHFKSSTEPYFEDYTGTKRQLLARAINELRDTVSSGSLFFVEDTSLRIEVLSQTGVDYPGVAVKEWFTETRFDQLDSLLQSQGNDRRATIKSDIALHVPGLGHPVFFEGSVSGRVADSPPEFAENPKYPWLTPKTFNGWFIPNGVEKRLGEMSIEEAWGYDFRIRALESLLSRLEEYTGVLNLYPQAYTRRQHFDLSTQMPLFAGLILVIVGPSCAGKTTFGEYAQEKHDAMHIEASAVLRMLRRDEPDDASDAFTFAREFLSRNGPDIIARKIVQIYSSKFDKNVVVTGFRTIEEIEFVKDSLPQARVVYIDASERTRFERHIARGRTPDCVTLEDFRRSDEQQASFGLLRVAEHIADTRIVNEGSMEDFKRQIDALMTGSQLDAVGGVSVAAGLAEAAEKTQLFRSLRVLDQGGRPMTCDEIEEITARTGTRIRHNNVNKVLKRVPELARRIETEGVRVRYEIQNAGRAYLRYMLRTEQNRQR